MNSNRLALSPAHLVGRRGTEFLNKQKKKERKTYDSTPPPENSPSGNDLRLLCDKLTILKSTLVLKMLCGNSLMLLRDKSRT